MPPLLFAWFSNPLILWGLGAASIPVIIHLLNKRKHREMPWAAMRFLLAAIEKNRRRVRIEQWLLLAIRTLLVILIVLAMAKPVLESQGAIPLLPGQRTHWVIALDGSMSMAYAPGDTARFETAKSIAAQLVRAARQGDGVSILMIGDPPRVIIGAPAFNHAEALKELASARLPHGGTDLAASFRKIREVLDSSDIPRKELVVLTDLQAATWNRAGSSADEGLKESIARLTSGSVRSSVIDLGDSGDANRAVVDLRLDPPLVTPATPLTVRGTLRAFGPGAEGAIAARLIVDGRVVREESYSPGPEGEVEFAFPYRFESAGDHVIEVQIDEDAQPLDDRRLVALPVREAIRVLLVDGDPRVETLKTETAFLAEAISPTAEPTNPDDPRPPASPIRVEIVADAQLAGTELAPYDVVALCNVARFTATEASALDAYLKQGGGLVVFGGDQVVPENYNQLLYDGGNGLLPAELGPVVGDTGQGVDPFQFDPLGFRHPILALFYGEQPGVTASLTNVKTVRYHRLTLPAGSPARVALAFTGGAPAIVEGPRHRGRVVLVATSADTGWTAWPLHRSYPAVMEQVMLQAASGKVDDRNVRVGRPLVQAFPPAAAGATASLSRPDGTTVDVELRSEGDISVLQSPDTEISGVTMARVGPPVDQELAFAANVDPTESNPAKLTAADLRDAVAGWPFVYDDDWRPLQDDAASLGQRGEFHRPLLWVVLALLLTESLVAWRFGHHSPRVRA